MSDGSQINEEQNTTLKVTTLYDKTKLICCVLAGFIVAFLFYIPSLGGKINVSALIFGGILIIITTVAGFVLASASRCELTFAGNIILIHYIMTKKEYEVYDLYLDDIMYGYMDKKTDVGYLLIKRTIFSISYIPEFPKVEQYIKEHYLPKPPAQ